MPIHKVDVEIFHGISEKFDAGKTKFQSNSSESCWDIPICTKVVDRPTFPSSHAANMAKNINLCLSVCRTRTN